MTSQKFPFQNGTSHRDSVFTPWNRAKREKKSLFMPENIFPGTNLYPLCISMFLKQNKYFVFSILQDVSFKKTNAATPLVNRFC